MTHDELLSVGKTTARGLPHAPVTIVDRIHAGAAWRNRRATTLGAVEATICTSHGERPSAQAYAYAVTSMLSDFKPGLEHTQAPPLHTGSSYAWRPRIAVKIYSTTCRSSLAVIPDQPWKKLHLLGRRGVTLLHPRDSVHDAGVVELPLLGAASLQEIVDGESFAVTRARPRK